MPRRLRQCNALKVDIQEYLGIKVDKLKDRRVDKLKDCRLNLSQPQLIESIFKDLRLDQPNATFRPTPAQVSKDKTLHRDLHGMAFEEAWDTLLQRRRHETHQCARFNANSKASHAEAVQHIGRYLVGTKDKGFILDPKEHLFEVWSKADWAGLWKTTPQRQNPARDTSSFEEKKSPNGAGNMYWSTANASLVLGGYEVEECLIVNRLPGREIHLLFSLQFKLGL
jgi:hypothetical protein